MKNNSTNRFKKLLFSIVLFFALATNAQKNEWVWQAGSSLGNQPPVYGKQNIPNSTNTPGGRGAAATWTDKAGNFWMFGGESYTNPSADADTTIIAHFCSDMWKFNPVTTEWVWVSGSKSVNAPGVYGKRGVASAKNLPGARGEGINWVDASGNFWMFGGLGFDSTTNTSGNNPSSALLNDLWMYNPAKNQWTWVAGSEGHNTNGNYATKNIASGGMPGSRIDAAGASDLSGNFWMFGGQGYGQSSASSGALGDLWEYVTATRQWIWQSGSNQQWQFGNYGTKGTGSINNYPSSKEDAMAFSDALGNFYVFGGYGRSDNTIPSGGGDQNDLWKYTPSNNEWTWVNGTSQGNQIGVYGKLGSSNPFNTPGGRISSITWLDSSKNFWMFGGDGADSAGGGFGELADLWEYSVTTNQWAFMGGKAGIAGQYGTLGTPSPNNLPVSRYAGQSWIDAAHNLWLYGGFGVFSSNDFYDSWLADAWELITPISALPIILANLQAVAKGAGNLLTWQTVGEINSAYFDVQRSSSNVVNFSTIGTVTAAGNSDVTLGYSYTDVQPLQGDNLYRLKMVDKDGKINYSAIVSVNRSAGFNLKIYPNPVADVLRVDGLDSYNPSNITVVDNLGNKLSQTTTSGSSYTLNIQQLPAGSYYLQVTANKTTTTLKFVKK